jgi:hypothetical protein
MKTESYPALSELKQRLQQSPTQTSGVFVGFDGFVDTIMKVVRQKHNYHNEYIDTISEFASAVQEGSGRSRQFELVTERVKLGGNAPILVNALSRLTIPAICAGSVGDPTIHPIFSEMDPDRLIPLANPGDSRALEFSDGKIILSELSAFDHYNWSTIVKTNNLDKIRQSMLNSKLIAFVDWANLPFASDIWDGVLCDIIKTSNRKDFRFFFDLCDPSKKTTEQIDEVFDLMGAFAVFGDVTLGLNENETIRIWCAFHGVDPMDKEHIPAVEQAGRELFNMINIQCLLVHPIDRTIVFRPHETISQKGRVVVHPKVLTGGGDNLNAGYIYGLLNNYPPDQCMLLGMATSGAYIQNGASPSVEDIINYITTWMDELKETELAQPVHVFTHRHE